MILVFDLDETLFNEIDYVRSGFEAVSRHIGQKWNHQWQEVNNFMLDILKQEGRGKVFDHALKKFGKPTKANIKKCISIYRLHNPKIALLPDAERCLERFKGFSLYILTDGNKLVQHKKIKALGLEDRVKKVIITYRHGVNKSKPSPYCFLKIAKLERAEPKDIIYIGDDPSKDFIGIKPYGFKTIRIMRGKHRETRLTNHHDAHIEINTLDELTTALISELKRNDRD